MTCTTTHHPGCDCHEARRDAEIAAVQQALQEREAEVEHWKEVIWPHAYDSLRTQAERIERLEKIGNKLSFYAQTTGGTAGPDGGLMLVISEWQQAFSSAAEAGGET